MTWLERIRQVQEQCLKVGSENLPGPFVGLLVPEDTEHGVAFSAVETTDGIVLFDEDRWGIEQRFGLHFVYEKRAKSSLH